MSEEPGYIRQTAEAEHMADVPGWFRTVADEAKAEGFTFARFSVDDNNSPTRAIVECWIKQPKDQGEIRWALTLDSKLSENSDSQVSSTETARPS